MENDVGVGLTRIAKGAAYLFTGTVVGKFFSFFSKIVLGRHYGPEQYGIYVMFLTILSISTVVATLGMGEGVVRFIGYLKGKRKRYDHIIISSLFAVSLTAILVTAFVYTMKDTIAIRLLHNPDASSAILAGLLAIFLSPLIAIEVAVLRGIERAKTVALISNAGIPAGVLTVAVLSALLNLNIKAVVFGVGVVYLFIFLSYSTIIKKCVEIKRLVPDFKTVKMLIGFSAPLAVTSIIALVMAWTDTVMLGYFYGSKVVGVYNVAVPIAKQLSMFLGFIAFIYGPFCSSLYARNKISEIGRIYQILTKWVMFGALPLFVIVFVFPKAVINILFGHDYLAAASALRILSFAFLINVMLGLNGYTLIVFGNTRFLFFAGLVGGTTNILLNYLLIPRYGMVGAAVASATAIIILNALYSFKLYISWGIHPFTTSYLKSILASLISIGIVSFLSSTIRVTIPVAVLFLLIFGFVYAMLLVIMRAFDEEDIVMVKKVGQKLDLPVEKWIKILKRIAK